MERALMIVGAAVTATLVIGEFVFGWWNMPFLLLCGSTLLAFYGDCAWRIAKLLAGHHPKVPLYYILTGRDA